MREVTRFVVRRLIQSALLVFAVMTFSFFLIHLTPGGPETALMQNPEINAQFISKIPVGRWGKVEEIGQLALFLCSEHSGFITGTDILIDGGWCAQ